MRESDAIENARRVLGAKLATYRRAAGYNQAEFASLIDYSRSTIANVETGRQHVPGKFWTAADTALHTGCALPRLTTRSRPRCGRSAGSRAPLPCSRSPGQR